MTITIGKNIIGLIYRCFVSYNYQHKYYINMYVDSIRKANALSIMLGALKWV